MTLRLTLLSALCLCTIITGHCAQLGAQDKAASALAIPATDDGLPGAGPIRRSEWFQKTWMGRRQNFVKDASNKQNAVVFFGDSITQ
ncbi:MAG: G-D-S-L family lipolytic protein, partial [Pirellulaceae bacterium]|nr:G-D-S-L family lipolytic protein [Pirellulaceae bacterium]